MRQDAKFEELLARVVAAYASKPGADYETAKRLFDLRWKEDEFFRATILEAARTHDAAHSKFVLFGDPNQNPPAACSSPDARTLTLRETFAAKITVARGAFLGANDPAHKSLEPPRAAEFFLSLLLSGSKGNALLGDLNEHFNEDCGRYGAGRARRLYWARTLHSLWPLLRRAAGRVFRWGVVIDAVRRYWSS